MALGGSVGYCARGGDAAEGIEGGSASIQGDSGEFGADHMCISFIDRMELFSLTVCKCIMCVCNCMQTNSSEKS